MASISHQSPSWMVRNAPFLTGQFRASAQAVLRDWPRAPARNRPRLSSFLAGTRPTQLSDQPTSAGTLNSLRSVFAPIPSTTADIAPTSLGNYVREHEREHPRLNTPPREPSLQASGPAAAPENRQRSMDSAVLHKGLDRSEQQALLLWRFGDFGLLRRRRRKGCFRFRFRFRFGFGFQGERVRRRGRTTFTKCCGRSFGLTPRNCWRRG